MARRKRLGCSMPLMAALVIGITVSRLLEGQATSPAAPTKQDSAQAPAARGPAPALAPGASPRPPKAVRSPFTSDSPWASPEACERALKQQTQGAKHAAGTPRIGTWNLAWFPAGTAHGDDPDRMHDIPWMACIVAVLGVQVLAVQEVVTGPAGRAAMLDLLHGLDTRTSGRWRVELDDCPDDGRQHLGFLYDDKRVQLLSTTPLPELNPARSACDRRLRPGLAARLRYRERGPDFEAVTVHFDSGAIARDYDHRKLSLARLASALPKLLAQHDHDDDMIVLGDFNTMGCAGCEPKIQASDEISALDATVDAYVPSLRNLAPEHACSEYYKGHGGRLDHVLVTRGMRELGPGQNVRTHGLCEALRCERGSSVARLPSSLRLSDHCPVVLTLDPKDDDADTKR